MSPKKKPPAAAAPPVPTRRRSSGKDKVSSAADYIRSVMEQLQKSSPQYSSNFHLLLAPDHAATPASSVTLNYHCSSPPLPPPPVTAAAARSSASKTARRTQNRQPCLNDTTSPSSLTTNPSGQQVWLMIVERMREEIIKARDVHRADLMMSAVKQQQRKKKMKPTPSPSPQLGVDAIAAGANSPVAVKLCSVCEAVPSSASLSTAQITNHGNESRAVAVTVCGHFLCWPCLCRWHNRDQQKHSLHHSHRSPVAAGNTNTSLSSSSSKKECPCCKKILSKNQVTFLGADSERDEEEDAEDENDGDGDSALRRRRRRRSASMASLASDQRDKLLQAAALPILASRLFLPGSSSSTTSSCCNIYDAVECERDENYRMREADIALLQQRTSISGNGAQNSVNGVALHVGAAELDVDEPQRMHGDVSHVTASSAAADQSADTTRSASVSMASVSSSAILYYRGDSGNGNNLLTSSTFDTAAALSCCYDAYDTGAAVAASNSVLHRSEQKILSDPKISASDVGVQGSSPELVGDESDGNSERSGEMACNYYDYYGIALDLACMDDTMVPVSSLQQQEITSSSLMNADGDLRMTPAGATTLIASPSTIEGAENPCALISEDHQRRQQGSSAVSTYCGAVTSTITVRPDVLLDELGGSCSNYDSIHRHQYSLLQDSTYDLSSSADEHRAVANQNDPFASINCFSTDNGTFSKSEGNGGVMAILGGARSSSNSIWCSDATDDINTDCNGDDINLVLNSSHVNTNYYADVDNVVNLHVVDHRISQLASYYISAPEYGGQHMTPYLCRTNYERSSSFSNDSWMQAKSSPISAAAAIANYRASSVSIISGDYDDSIFSELDVQLMEAATERTVPYEMMNQTTGKLDLQVPNVDQLSTVSSRSSAASTTLSSARNQVVCAAAGHDDALSDGRLMQQQEAGAQYNIEKEWAVDDPRWLLTPIRPGHIYK